MSTVTEPDSGVRWADDVSSLAELPLEERLAAVRASRPARPEQPRVTLADQLLTLAVGTALAFISLTFVRVPGLPDGLGLGSALLLCVPGVAVFSRSWWRRLGQLTPTFWLFLFAHFAYLGYLFVVSIIGDHLPQLAFVKGGLLLIAAAAGALHLVTLRERGQLSSFLIRVAWCGLALTAAAALFGFLKSGVSPLDYARAFVSGNVQWVLYYNQRSLLALAGIDPFVADANAAPVLKNTFAEGLGFLAALVLLATADRKRGFAAWLLVGVLCFWATLMMSRSAILGIGAALAWIALASSRRSLVNMAVVGTLAAAAVGLAWAMPSEGEGSIIGGRIRAEKSDAFRMNQYRFALTDERNPKQILFGSGVAEKVDGYRIHNLVLSSWIEGGLIALAAVLTQYAALVGAWWRCWGRGAFAWTVAALLPLAVVRTMVSGAGGYYTQAGLLAACVLLAFAPRADGRATAAPSVGGTT